MVDIKKAVTDLSIGGGSDLTWSFDGFDLVKVKVDSVEESFHSVLKHDSIANSPTGLNKIAQGIAKRRPGYSQFSILNSQFAHLPPASKTRSSMFRNRTSVAPPE